MIVLGIESSCDEMAAAVLDGSSRALRSNVIHSQADLHAIYGGVVPELASRDHVRTVSHVIRRALDAADIDATDLDGIAVTSGPGLIGSLLCGVQAAKGLALALRKPLVGVNHLEGHIAAAFLENPPPQTPFVALVVSGGHTSLILVHALGGPYECLGSTRDDAAGEAFDKTAKLLGLGYPGGVAIDRLAEDGDDERFAFPQAMPGKDNLDFSFSGLKTAASRQIRDFEGRLEGQALRDFCASFEKAIVDNLLKKSFRAATKSKTKRLALVGGVAANRQLRRRAQYRGKRERVVVYQPALANCTDNAAMIAMAGHARLCRGERHGLDLSCLAHWLLA